MNHDARPAMIRSPHPAFILLATVLVTGCATQIKTSLTQNPPPSEKFASFNRFEIHPITMGAPYAGQDANERATRKIQENLDLRASPLLQRWSEAADSTQPARTLVIQPRIEEIKFISGGSRFWAGAWAGSSAVILRASFMEKETKRIIAAPEFYARAAAMGGAWSFGGTDNAMLVRIANRLSDYLEGNYAAAVGGPTGAEPRRE